MSHFDDTLNIRAADHSDIPVIATLAHAIWPSAYGEILSESQLAYMLKLFYSSEALEKQMQEGQRFIIAEVNAEPVGFAAFTATSQQHTVLINKLYVHVALQGKGIGRVLLERILREAKAVKRNEVQLYVNRHNPAKNFYERCGFAVAKEVNTPIGENYFMDDYLMVKSLQPGATAISR